MMAHVRRQTEPRRVALRAMGGCALLVAVLLAGCRGGVGVEEDSIPTLTRVEQVPRHIGEVVTLRGEVSNTKVAGILGVDVGASEDVRGKYGQATGVLERSRVTAEQLEAGARKYGEVANRGPGVFVRLRAIDSYYLAPVIFAREPEVGDSHE